MKKILLCAFAAIISYGHSSLAMVDYWNLDNAAVASGIDLEKIASKYQANIGNFLLPAHQKVYVKDWHNPDLDDYVNIQNYLSFAYRPELQYVNYPGTDWREKRIRKFQIISKTEIPKFEVVHLNNSPLDKKACIVTYVSCNERYEKNIELLIERLRLVGFDGHLIYRVGGWPCLEEDSLQFFDVPYAFKIYSIIEAKNLGYEKCMWLDSCFKPLKNLDPVFTHINEHGVLFYATPEYSQKHHLPEMAAEALGITLEEWDTFTFISSFLVGFDFNNKTALNLLEFWRELLEKRKLGFLSFTPEQATLGILVNKLGLLPCAVNRQLIATNINEINSESVLFWNHDDISVD